MLNVGLSIRDADGRAVVALCGEFNLADAPGVASHLITAVAACGPSVIVDLAGLQSIGYSGLAVLLRIRKWTRRSGGDLALAAPQPTVRRVLEASGLIDVFSVYRSVDQAASGARHVPPPVPPPMPAPPVPPPVQVSMVSRPAHRRPVYRMPCHSPARPLYRSGTCRSRHTPRDTCGKRRSPGGRTAA
jgi:anti-sigma B factor antagonist